jgi:hypothetical protein
MLGSKKAIIEGRGFDCAVRVAQDFMGAQSLFLFRQQGVDEF